MKRGTRGRKGCSGAPSLCEKMPLGEVGREPLQGVWGASSSDVFAAGHHGTILHYDGISWTPMQSGTTEILQDVWGASSSDVFAAGGGGILHFDGTSWSWMQVPEGEENRFLLITGIWGSSSDNVWAASGSAWVVYHYDGMRWSVALHTGSGLGSEGFFSIWGSSSTDVWVAGSAGQVYHYSPRWVNESPRVLVDGQLKNRLIIYHGG